MDRVTRAKIDSLLYELRGWDEPRESLEELARRYSLDPMLVARIAQAEGVQLGESNTQEHTDPNQTTQVMDSEELERELGRR